MEVLRNLFRSDFMPHGHCFLWRPDVLWLNVGSDLLIALAYFSIPLALLSFVRRRPGLNFGFLFWMFGAFIFLCGTTHLVEIWTVWNGVYHFQGLVKFATAGVSLATAGVLWMVIPKALQLPLPSELSAKNRELQEEILRREQVEAELRRAHSELGERIQERTGALERANRELESSNRELDEFAHVVSHDLKAPLRGITSLASWISTDCAAILPDESKEHLGQMTGRARRMSELIDGILRYSRLGRTKRELSAVDAHAIAAEVIDSLEPPQAIRVRIDGRLPVVVYDRTQLVQVFQNLIENAIQHLGKPTGEIVVSCQPEPDSFRIAVQDDGRGIDERHFDRIFKMFQVLGRSAEEGSTGVGLAIVKRIVENHGGSITVESVVGSGTTFRFSVPRSSSRFARQPESANG
jgi:signal transduction histidine kinase